MSLLFTYIVPFRYTAPCALVMAGLALHGAAQQCSAFCRGSGVERAAVQLAPGARRLPAFGWYAALQVQREKLAVAGLAAEVQWQGLLPNLAAGSLCSCQPADLWSRLRLASLLWLCLGWKCALLLTHLPASLPQS